MNRLAEETSPYLLQHADNPVDWYPWGDEGGDHVERHARQIAPVDPADLARVSIRPQEPPVGVLPEELEEHGDDDEGEPVGEGSLAGAFLLQVLGEDLRREWHEGDAHEQEKIDEEKGPIRFPDEREDDVVVDPHDPDREEAERIREVRRPDVEQPVADVVSRDLHLEDEKRRRDGEDAVGERLQAARGHGGTVSPG